MTVTIGRRELLAALGATAAWPLARMIERLERQAGGVASRGLRERWVPYLSDCLRAGMAPVRSTSD
jgi:hypothetical protein